MVLISYWNTTPTVGTGVGPGTQSLAYQAMATDWSLLHDLLGGTSLMRLRTTTWLPKNQKENDDLYKSRVNRSFLLETLKDAVAEVSSKPFEEPVSIENAGELSEQLAAIEANADYSGTDLTGFARMLIEDAVIHGMTHVLVEFSDANRVKQEAAVSGNPIPEVNGTIPAGIEKGIGLRPYFVHVPAANLIAWKATKDAAGRDVLTEIRIYEKRVEPEGEWGEQIVEYIRVYRPTEWILYRKTATEAEWGEFNRGTNTLGKIPLVTFYTRRKGFMVSEAPMQGLGWLSLAHWQSSSEQRNILHIARVPILVGAGWEDGDPEPVVGAQEFTRHANPQGKLYYTEHSGQSIEAGERDLAKLESQMNTQSAAPYVEHETAAPTATRENRDDARANCDIKSWVRDLSVTLKSAYTLAAEWIGEILPEDFVVKVFSDFDIGRYDSTDKPTLMELSKNRKITDETLLSEMKRRKVFPGDFDPKQEAQDARNQAPDLATLAGFADASAGGAADRPGRMPAGMPRTPSMASAMA